MCKENQKKKHNKVISVILIISMLFTMTFISFAEDGIGELAPEYPENQNEVMDKNNMENENTENLDNEENKVPEENPGESSNENTEESADERNQEPEENKDPEKDINNIFDGFDFGKIDIGKVGEILNPGGQEDNKEKEDNNQDQNENQEQTNDEDIDTNENPDENKPNDLETHSEDSGSLFDNIGNLFDKIKDYVNIDEDDKLLEEIREEINLEEIDMTVQCDELFFTVTGKAPEGTILKVEKLEENFEEKIKEELKGDKDFRQLAAFDIKLIKPDGSQYQPIDFGEKVKFSVIGIEGSVCRIENDIITDMNSEFRDKETTFETDHFSTYVIGMYTFNITRTISWNGMTILLSDYYGHFSGYDTAILTGTQTGSGSLEFALSGSNMNIKMIFLDGNFMNFDNLCNGMSGLLRVDVGPRLNTERVTTMNGMFSGCDNISHISLKGADLSKVGQMWNLFDRLRRLETVDMTNVKMRKGVQLSDMFRDCRRLDRVGTPIIAKSNDSIRESTDGTFPFEMYDQYGSTYTSLPILEISKILYKNRPAPEYVTIDGENMRVIEKGKWLGMDYVIGINDASERALLLTGTQNQSRGSSSLPKSFLECKKVVCDAHLTDCKNLFNSFYKNVSEIFKFGPYANTLSITDMSNMFSYVKFKEIDFRQGFNCSNVINMSRMFSSCNRLIKIHYGDNFNTINVTNMSGMFEIDFFAYGFGYLINYFINYKIENYNISYDNYLLIDFDSRNVTDMSRMFKNNISKGFKFGDKFNTKNVENFSSMFENCIKDINISNFNISKGISFINMFYGCYFNHIEFGDVFKDLKDDADLLRMFASSRISYLDLSNFKITNQTNVNGMCSFKVCPTVKTPKILGKEIEFRNEDYKISKETGKIKNKIDTPNETLTSNLKCKKQGYKYYLDNRKVKKGVDQVIVQYGNNVLLYYEQ